MNLCRREWLGTAAVAALVSLGGAVPAQAVEISFAAHMTSYAEPDFDQVAKEWGAKTGNTVKLVPMPNSSSDQFAQYRLWLAAGNEDVDLYQTDIVWAPQMADQFVDLTEAGKDLAGSMFPSVIESQTVDGKLVAMPMWTDAPALYYRKDLLEKYGLAVPKTWSELAAAAKTIQDGERAAGNPDFWGYVWQGNAYEGLTCNALEWVKSFGGGQIVEANGSIDIFNDKAVAAVTEAASWIGTISPPGVLTYEEEESRGVWQIGNAAFMRNWPYAYSLGDGADSAIKGKFATATLPAGSATDKPAASLGGWNIAVSKYSRHKEAAISFALFMAGREAQKTRAMHQANLPTIVDLYDDPDVAAATPIIPQWKSVFLNAVPRPSAPTKGKYNEVSSKFYSAVHETLSGNGSAADNLEVLQSDLKDIEGGHW